MIRSIINCVLILISFDGCAQHLVGLEYSKKKQKLSFNDSLNFLGERLNSALEEEWIVECYDSSIVISYCKSCADFANDSIKLEIDRLKENDQSYFYPDQGSGFRRYRRFLKLRYSYKETHGLDSLTVNSTFCRYPFHLEHKDKTTFSVKFKFKERFEDEYYESIQYFNDSIYEIWKLKDENGDKFVMPKVDNRLFIIPFSKYFSGIASQKRVPYFSNKMDNAVFIEPSDNLICNYYFDFNQKNASLKRKIYIMLVGVAHELGLNNFTYLGEDFRAVDQENVYPKKNDEK